MNLNDHFLIASVTLAGDYFGGSLIYVCEHSSNGAMGFIVNRTSEFSLSEVLTQVGVQGSATAGQIGVLDGGPVNREQGFVLHSSDSSYPSSHTVSQDVSLTTAMEALEDIGDERGPSHALMLLGYAGWGPGQLEEELKQNAWLAIPADPEVLFSTPVDQRQQAAGRLLGIDVNLIGRPGTA